MKNQLALLGFCLLTAGLLVSPVHAVPCLPGEVLGVTTYTNAFYSAPASACGGWKRTGGPTILNFGIGVWQRACTYNCGGTVKKVEQCYASKWDEIWAHNGSMHTVTPTAIPPGTTLVQTQTKICFTGTPPADVAPPSFTRITVGSPVQIDLAKALSRIELPAYEPDLPFSEVVLGLAPRFAEAAAEMKALAVEASLPENNDDKKSDPELIFALFDLSQSLSELGLGLEALTFGQPATYVEIADSLRFIARHPVLLESELHAATSETLLVVSSVWDSIAEAIERAAGVFEIDAKNPPQTVGAATEELDIAVAAAQVLDLFQRAGEAGRQYGHRFATAHQAIAGHVEAETSAQVCK